MPDNVKFIFRYGNEVQVKVKPGSRRDPGPQWELDGRPLTPGDGAETILDRTRLSYSEGGSRTDLQVEQIGGSNFNSSGGYTSNDIRDRAREVIDILPGRGAARRD